ncbi:flavin reductase family protein [Microbacterium sp. gxy059]|uniref:flavin reductase family protein n=1 Tax=Microbacterium sp. gxy059 TaxID=2957199 RepID=UPI003D974834
MSNDVPSLGDRFKAAFRDHPAAVTLITAQTPEGPVGLTASSVASVATDPPALSFSVTRATGTAGALLASGDVFVHFLTPDHIDTAGRFAVSGGERFTPEQGWSFDDDGAPRLAGERARLRARIVQTVPVGSSVLVVAHVSDIDQGEGGTPLVYADRRFFPLTAEGVPLTR